MKITRAWLEKREACPEQVAIFATEWPNGIELSEASLQRAAELKLSIGWLTSHILNAKKRARHNAETAVAWARHNAESAAAKARYKAEMALIWARYDAETATALWRIYSAS